MLRYALQAPAYLYRWRCGWLLGHRFVLLGHVGRRSGRRHHTVLEVLERRSDGPELVVMNGFGPKADWFLNMEATPGPEIVFGSRRFIATHHVLDVMEAADVFAHYERRHRIAAPIIRWVLSCLVGWRYDGSEAARDRLLAQLPLIPFSPRSRPAPGPEDSTDVPIGADSGPCAHFWHDHAKLDEG